MTEEYIILKITRDTSNPISWIEVIYGIEELYGLDTKILELNTLRVCT